MKRILFADDDPSIQDIVTLIFEGEYEVDVFPDGARLMANDFELPDLFLLDKQMPGLSGLDVCTFLKSQEWTKHIPVIIISASPQLKKGALAAGADDVIEKPFQISELRNMISAFTSAPTLY